MQHDHDPYPPEIAENAPADIASATRNVTKSCHAETQPIGNFRAAHGSLSRDQHDAQTPGADASASRSQSHLSTNGGCNGQEPTDADSVVVGRVSGLAGLRRDHGQSGGSLAGTDASLAPGRVVEQVAVLRIAPCPWCGGKAVMDERTVAPDWYVGCDSNDCLATGPVRATFEAAVNVWNRVGDALIEGARS